MSGAASGKDQVNAQIPKDLSDYLFRRADRIGWKKAKFVAELIIWWAAQGAPAIHEVDASMPIPPPPSGSKKLGTTEGPVLGQPLQEQEAKEVWEQ